MFLPMQSEPVERTLVGQPSFAGEHGVTAGACGVQPSDWLSDIGNVVSTIGKVGGAVAPFLGMI